MIRFYYIAVFALLGFFLTPTASYACSQKSNDTEMPCCKDDNSETEKKGCCQKNDTDNESNDCDGKCGNSSCHCPTSAISFIVPDCTGFSQRISHITKPTNYYGVTYTSSGFYSIWTPPNIG